MRWPTHETAAVLATISLKLSSLTLIGAFVGSILPDLLDQKVAKLFGWGRRNEQKIFGQIHRGFSHWFGLYLALLFFAKTQFAEGAVQEVLLGLGLGGLSHVLLDFLTAKGVPLLPFVSRPRLSLPLCKTGGLSEYCFLALLCAAFFLYWQGDAWEQLRRSFLHVWAQFF